VSVQRDGDLRVEEIFIARHEVLDATTERGFDHRVVLRIAAAVRVADDRDQRLTFNESE
jgi:hypothetical protein